MNAYFQCASHLLGTDDRFSSVQQAFRLGLLLHETATFWKATSGRRSMRPCPGPR
jgi:hypothetical protein